MPEDKSKKKGSQAEIFDEGTGRYPGDTNFQKWGFDLHPVVAPVAGGVVILFIVLTLANKEQASKVFNATLNGIANYGGWFYILVANIFLGLILYFAFSKFGRIRLGGQDAKPEFSTFAWFAMLLSAGMGIGLMFWSVGEPMWHFASPPAIFGSEPSSPKAAETAMTVTFFHWGLHPWGLYALVGLGLAFFAFNRGLPLTMRSLFHPLLGERIYEWPGHIIDILAVVADLFGLATSLGLGVSQVAGGLTFLTDRNDLPFPEGVGVEVALIAVITGFAIISVMVGLDGGVRRLSEWNLYLATIFLLFVLVVGPTLFILDSFVQNLGNYVASFPLLSFWTESFGEGPEDGSWQNAWTVFYWGWWISWSPFVGMFIARVSKGRTIREFVIGVLIVPSLISFLWLSATGGTALNLLINKIGNIPNQVFKYDEGAFNGVEVSKAMFVMLDNLPFTLLTSIVAILLVTIFFVTSSDSGSLVVDNLTSGGKLDSPAPQRVFWATMEGVVAAVLLVGGGLEALQTAAITTGLPFALVLLIMSYSLNRGLNVELSELEMAELQEAESEAEEYAQQRGIEAHNR